MVEASKSLGERRPEDVQATFCDVLITEWIRQGLRHAVIAPGSRSTPLALSLMRAQRDGAVTVDIYHDERSAAFAALGSGLVSGKPAVVVCTSGTAAAHLHAAVIEANLSAVPMIVCTADRPPELRDVGAPQTIDQTKLYGDAVRWFHDPGVPAVEGAPSWRSLAARTYWSSVGPHAGPVHLNLPFREPLVGSSIAELMAAGNDSGPTREFLIGRSELSSADIVRLAREMSGRRGVIFAGRGCGRPESVEALARALGWPVVGEPRSGCGGGNHTIAHADAVVRVRDVVDSLAPEIVLRLGEPPASKVLGQWVSTCKARQIHVSGSGQMFDPDHSIDLRIEVEVDRFLGVLAESSSAVDHDVWFAHWKDADDVVRRILDETDGESGPWTGLSATRAIVRALPHRSHLVLSSSMPVRDAEWFAGDCSHVVVHANRGANGIDGVIATAAGVARASRQPTFVVVGDVAAIHDASTLLSLVGRDLDVRIVVLNNDGGGIFHHLPQATTVDEATFEAIYGTPHGIQFASLAHSLGIRTWVIDENREVLARALAEPGPSLIEIHTDRKRDLRAHRSFHERVELRLRSSKA